MPADRTGLAGKICDALNDAIERNEKLVKELERLSNVVGKAGNIKQRASLPNAEGQWATAIDSVNTLVSDLVQPTTEVARVIGAVAKGDLSQSMALEIDGRPLTGEFLRTAKIVNTMVDQLGTFASEVTRVAREVGTEGQARRPGGREGRGRHLEGPHRQRQLHGRQPDHPGAQHRRSHHRGRARRPLEEDHRRRARRDPRAEEHHQHDGRSAQLVRLGSHARGEGSRHRRQAGRPGGGQGRRRHVEGPDRQRQSAGRQPHRAAARRVEGRDGDRERRPDAEDHGRSARRDPADQERHQHDGRPAERVRLGSHARGARGRHRRQAGRPGRRARRRRHVARPHRPSTRWPAT